MISLHTAPFSKLNQKEHRSIYNIYSEECFAKMRMPLNFDEWRSLRNKIEQASAHDCVSLIKNEISGEVLAYVYEVYSADKKLELFFGVPLNDVSAELHEALCNYLHDLKSEKKFTIRTSSSVVQSACEAAQLKAGNNIQHLYYDLAQNAERELSQFKGLPDGITAEWQYIIKDFALASEIAQHITTCLNDMQRANKHEHFKITGDEILQVNEDTKFTRRSLHLILRDKDSRFLGLCFGFSQVGSSVCEQRMTGLHKTLRGNGIGTIMKSMCYVKLKEEYPHIKTVLTDCYCDNAPILKTNLKMGFQKHYIVKEYYN